MDFDNFFQMMEQHSMHLENIALMMGKYKEDLVKAGFSEETAEQMVEDYHKIFHEMGKTG